MATGPRRETPVPEDGPGEDDLFDLFLDEALEGGTDDPADFLERHPEAGDALRDRVEALHRMLRRPGPAPSRTTPGLEPGDGLPLERVGGFRLLRRLGRGGMGEVFLAEQESLGRLVALKILRSGLRDSATAAARFDREAQAVARLRHPSIVTLYEAGIAEGTRYIAMEIVPGRGLDELLDGAREEGRRLPGADAVRWAAQVARALQCAHEGGIVHRDVKPSNIRITPDGRALLLDFGIAREESAGTLTRTGMFLGSPAYAAPEQVTGGGGGPADPRTDVYGLAATLYECLAGSPPYDAATVDQAIRMVLTTDPDPVRRRNPSISRDLEVVLMKALERDPARRFATAAAFADDLEALLEFRPIRARPPGALSRAVKWTRRHPARAAAGITAAVLVAGAAGLLLARDVAERADRRRQAAAAVAEARGRLEGLRRDRAGVADLERRLELLEEKTGTRYLTEEEDRLLREQEDAVAGRRREREAGFYEVLDLLRRAERLDPSVAGTAETRAAVHLERWREAETARDAPAAAFFRRLALAADATGSVAREIDGEGEVLLAVDPPGAAVYLFRQREQADLLPGGDRRLVPCPVQPGPPPLPPGTPVLESTRTAGGVARGDLLLSVDGEVVTLADASRLRARAAAGGVPARVLGPDGERTVTLPPHGRFRATAAPLVVSGACRVAPGSLRLPEGSYLALLRHPGREDQRVWFAVDGEVPARVRVDLLPEGSTPEGFVRVTRTVVEDLERPFWIMEREVTAAEYLEFLNAPATLETVERSPVPVLFPRGGGREPGGGYWRRGPDGRFSLPPDWSEDWPVLGISHEDARAYAAWRTGEARAAGSPLEYALPTFEEWIAAGCGAGGRLYVFGNRFRPKWMKSCYARPRASPEPVLSYPVDESPAGVFDMAGSAFEWCDAWYDEARGLRRLAGGAWGRADPEMFKVFGGFGTFPELATGEYGMRLVARPAGGPR